jgi:hypothetical protein
VVVWVKTLLTLLVTEIDPIQGIENLATSFLNALIAILLVVVGGIGIAHLSKNNPYAIIGTIVTAMLIGIFLLPNSKELLQGLSESLVDYMAGN